MLANKLGHKQLKMEGLSIAIVAYIPQFQCALCWQCAGTVLSGRYVALQELEQRLRHLTALLLKTAV